MGRRRIEEGREEGWSFSLRVVRVAFWIILTYRKTAVLRARGKSIWILTSCHPRDRHTKQADRYMY